MKQKKGINNEADRAKDKEIIDWLREAIPVAKEYADEERYKEERAEYLKRYKKSK